MGRWIFRALIYIIVVIFAQKYEGVSENMVKTKKKIMVFCSVALLAAGLLTAFAAPNYAAAATCKTTVLPQSLCNGSFDDFLTILKAIVKALTAAVTVLATVGILICGFFWMTARDNAQQVATVKRRLFDIVIGLLVWLMFSAFIQFLLPDTSGVDEWITRDAAGAIITELKK